LNGGCEGTAVVGDADCNYCEYYVYNGDGFTQPYSTGNEYVQYDGFTLVLTAVAVLECGQTYHIKLALADVSDTAFDSAVFIETDSFSSSGSVTSGVENPPTIDWPTNQIMEDCVDGQFVISTGGFDETVDTLFINWGGTATNGLDYEMLADFIVLEEGQSLDTLEIITIADGFGEGSETIEISFPFVNECGDLDTAFASLNLLEQTPLVINPINDIVLCGSQQATAAVSGGLTPYIIEWESGETTNSIPITELGNYSVSVTDYCGQSAEESFAVVPPSGVALEMEDEVFVCLGDDVDVTVEMTSGANPPSADWTGSNSSTLNATFDSNDAGYQYVTVTDACDQTAMDSILITIPSLLVGIDDLDLCVGVGTGQLAQGGTPDYLYDYDVEAFDPDQALVLVPNQAGVYTIVVTDQCGQEATIPVLVSVCDTTIPNVFTPNGDSENDVFEIRGVLDFPRSTLLIYNRWGNLIEEYSSYGNNWNGADCPEGVYYYIFQRSDGKNFEGYVHLLRE
ncbi:MAG: gliding motility-associated C-terminal domain-containing protein, partial [Flavobacteriales bacterium]